MPSSQFYLWNPVVQQPSTSCSTTIQQHFVHLTRAGLWYDVEVSTLDWTNHFPGCKRIQFSSLGYSYAGKENKIQRMAPATHCEHLPWHSFGLCELALPWDNAGQRPSLEMVLMMTLSGGGREMQAMLCHGLQSQRTSSKMFHLTVQWQPQWLGIPKIANINFIKVWIFFQCLAPYPNV